MHFFLGKEIIQYDVKNYLTSLEIHPKIEDVILCGTKDAILVFDLRVNFPDPVKTFTSNCKEVKKIINNSKLFFFLRKAQLIFSIIIFGQIVLFIFHLGG